MALQEGVNMQTDYLFHGLKGFSYFQRVCYLWNMETDTAQKRLKILKFFEKYGPAATLEAFDISRRTLYRWRSLYEKSNKDILALNPHSKAPKRTIFLSYQNRPSEELSQTIRIRCDLPHIELTPKEK